MAGEDIGDLRRRLAGLPLAMYLSPDLYPRADAYMRGNCEWTEFTAEEQKRITDLASCFPAVLKAYKPRRYGFVYFIQAEHGGPVKIGYSESIGKRLEQLQTSSPYRLRVIGRMRGGRTREKELHERFEHSRLNGEWFDLTDELQQLIDDSPDLEEANACK